MELHKLEPLQVFGFLKAQIIRALIQATFGVSNGVGTKLASATFTNETASGWQVVRFTTPVAISPNTTYVASYFSSVGRYASTPNFFTNSGVTNGSLTALRSGVDGGNGVYKYGTKRLSSFSSCIMAPIIG